MFGFQDPRERRYSSLRDIQYSMENVQYFGGCSALYRDIISFGGDTINTVEGKQKHFLGYYLPNNAGIIAAPKNLGRWQRSLVCAAKGLIRLLSCIA